MLENVHTLRERLEKENGEGVSILDLGKKSLCAR